MRGNGGAGVVFCTVRLPGKDGTTQRGLPRRGDGGGGVGGGRGVTSGGEHREAPLLIGPRVRVSTYWYYDH